MFLIYESGMQFLAENDAIFKTYPLETTFFIGNATNMPDMSKGFAVKAIDGADFLLCIRYLDFPMVLYGSERLCDALADGLLKNRLSFDRVLANESLAKAFMDSYERLAGGSHRILHAMDIMKCACVHDANTASVERAAPVDAEEIAALMTKFNSEILRKPPQSTSVLQQVQSEIHRFALIRRDSKAVSVAKTAHETDSLCAISGVYTLPAFRGQGMARQLVTFLTRRILAQGKTAYLFVEKANPVSNHLYQSIGYVYAIPNLEIQYIKQA